jgi:TldD protein
MKRFAFAFAIVLASSVATAEPTQTIRALKDELARSMHDLALPDGNKPYFISYGMWDVDQVDVSASFGALVASREWPVRTVDIDLRVGDAAFDNSNLSDRDSGRSVTLSRDDDYDAARREVWLATDRLFKHDVETLAHKHAIVSAEATDTDVVAAFSKEPPSRLAIAGTPPAIDRGKLEALAKQMSAVFRSNPDVYTGAVGIYGWSGTNYFMSSEGSESSQPSAHIHLVVSCSTQAADGMPLHDGFDVWVRAADELPAAPVLVARALALSRELSALRAAPVVDDYAGPILFENLAAGQVLHALVVDDFGGTPGMRSDRPGGHRIGESELAGKVGQRILPASVSVVDDPTRTKVDDQLMFGIERFDEEGVPVQKVSLVENGVFKRFVMSREPRKGFEHSNGHAASTSRDPVRAHPFNVIVSASGGLGDAAMRARAIAAAKADGLPYVLVVDRLDVRSYGDFDPSLVSDRSTVARPAIVKRVYTDGHEQLVRGALFGEINARSLRDITAIGTRATVYTFFGNGVASPYASMFANTQGYLASIASPPLLFKDVEVKPPRNSQRSAPVAARPSP